ncbi:MAG: AtpZ/AtpI family protein [Candidatus Theseobacter exili]|nr:AtpZ/AtpI family protein [Candidatus Theseobacter exili]
MAQRSLNQEAFQSLWIIAQLGLVMVCTILTGLGVGLFLDRFFGTTGIFLVIFILFGIAAGFYNVWKVLKRQVFPKEE